MTTAKLFIDPGEFDARTDLVVGIDWDHVNLVTRSDDGSQVSVAVVNSELPATVTQVAAWGCRIEVHTPIRTRYDLLCSDACLVVHRTYRQPDREISRFPHSCPSCGLPAYVGLNSVECTGVGCRWS